VSSAPVKSNRLEAYQLAKKVRCLAKAEGQALLPIADAVSMYDGECRKSLTTLAAEFKGSVRQYEYGIHGRQREDGTFYYPGLLKRGIIYVKALRDGVPTAYGINMDALRALVYGEKTPAQTPAQNEGDPCTNPDEPLHNDGQTPAQIEANPRTYADKVQEGAPKGQPSGTKERETEDSHSHDISQCDPVGSSAETETQKRKSITGKAPRLSKPSPEIIAVQSGCSRGVGRPPTADEVRMYLDAEYSPSEIINAFAEFFEGLDEKSCPRAAQTFFYSQTGFGFIDKMREQAVQLAKVAVKVTAKVVADAASVKEREAKKEADNAEHARVTALQNRWRSDYDAVQKDYPQQNLVEWFALHPSPACSWFEYTRDSVIEAEAKRTKKLVAV
jgi:hypothetical protein